MKVLIVEDDEDILESYKIALEQEKHQITATLDGEQCIQAYSNELKKLDSGDPGSLPFDVVVIDYGIPKKDGIQVAKEILALKPNQRIIFASAYIRDIVKEKLKSLNSPPELIENLQKPFGLADFIDKIELKDLIKSLDEFGLEAPKVNELNTHYVDCKRLLSQLEKLHKKYLIN